MPAGLADGARIRVPGKGHAGRNGGETATSTSPFTSQPHPLFRRDGDDLHIIVPVAIHEAALGAKIDVPSLDGPARLRVPPGTQSGQRFRLRERGVPSPRDGRRGDLVVEVAAGAAEAARRAVEGAAAGVRPDQRRGCEAGHHEQLTSPRTRTRTAFSI